MSTMCERLKVQVLSAVCLTSDVRPSTVSLGQMLSGYSGSRSRAAMYPEMSKLALVFFINSFRSEKVVS